MFVKSRKKSKRKKKLENNTRFIFKTIIDGLLSGLIAIGLYLGRPPSTKPVVSYLFILILISIVLVMIFIFSRIFGNGEKALGVFIVLSISIIEISIIGFIFGESLEEIFLALIIALPSVIIFDKLLG